MAVVSLKVPPPVKRKMKDYEQEVNWPEEIRKMITERIESLDRERVIQEVLKMLEDVPPAPKGTASRLVRRDRDSH
jgi:hypothetical protein